MSESPEVLATIDRELKGKKLLVGRKIGQSKLDILGASLRVEAKPHKYPTGEKVVAWEKRFFSKFVEGDFDSILLHRFLYKPVKDYIEDPEQVLSEVRRILPKGGVLVVNSYLLDDRTKGFRSAESFFTEQEMSELIKKQHFRRLSHLRVGDASLFVCEN